MCLLRRFIARKYDAFLAPLLHPTPPLLHPPPPLSPSPPSLTHFCQASQVIDTFVYFTTCIVYVIVVWLFLCTIALLLLQVRRESSAAYIDGQRQSKQWTLRATAQLVHRMSLQLSFLALLVVVCFFFRAGYAFPPVFLEESLV
jgi:hypothetical protein